MQTYKRRGSTLIGKVIDLLANNRMWVTFGDTVYYPKDVVNPMLPRYRHIRAHEAVHGGQVSRIGLPLFLFFYFGWPLPIFFAYTRWAIEREAFLVSIRLGGDIESIVNMLWKHYLYIWPKSLMRRWFTINSAK